MQLSCLLVTFVAICAAFHRDTDENHIVAHYRRVIRARRSVHKRSAAEGEYWPVDRETGQRNRFHPAAPNFLDIYIYAPDKYTTKQAGQSVHFDCELSDGYVGSWKRENDMPFSRSAELKKLNGRNIYRLDLEYLDYTDSGKYICSANTGNPADAEYVELNVQGDQPTNIADQQSIDDELLNRQAQFEQQQREQYEHDMSRRRQEQFWDNQEQEQQDNTQRQDSDPQWPDRSDGQIDEDRYQPMDTDNQVSPPGYHQHETSQQSPDVPINQDLDQNDVENGYDSRDGKSEDQERTNSDTPYEDGLDEAHHPYYQTKTTSDMNYWQRPVDFEPQADDTSNAHQNVPSIPNDSDDNRDSGDEGTNDLVNADHNGYTDYVYDYMVDE